MPNFGAAMRHFREAAGISQGDLSARLGMAQSMVSRRESGSIEVSLSELPAIARALEVSEETLIAKARELEGIDEAVRAIAVVGAVPAGWEATVRELTPEEKRSLPTKSPALRPVPDYSMADDLKPGDLAMVRRVNSSNVAGAIDGKLVYVIYTGDSRHGEPEFARAIAEDDGQIRFLKNHPGRGPRSWTVPLEEIEQIGVVVGVYQSIKG